MKILPRVIEPVAVDMVDNLTLFRPGDLAVFPLAAAAIASQALGLKVLRRMSIALYGLRTGWLGLSRLVGRADHLVAATHVLSMRQAFDLRLVGMERVAVLSRHLIVAPAHLLSDDRALAMDTGATDNLASPSVIGRSMPLLALVMHQAKPVCSVLPITTGYVASPHAANDNSLPKICKYKALGNSWAKSNGAWILARIADLLEQKRLAA